MTNDEIAIQAIDSRIVSIERTNDSYMAKYGKPNKGLMDLLNELMDKRDKLISVGNTHD